jgi:hypothetical protein
MKRKLVMRFVAKKVINQQDPTRKTVEVWEVVDTRNLEFQMPRKAVSISLSPQSAIQIAAVLNREWLEFLNNPT